MDDRCLLCIHYESCIWRRKKCDGFERVCLDCEYENLDKIIETQRIEYYKDWFEYISEYNDDIFF